MTEITFDNTGSALSAAIAHMNFLGVSCTSAGRETFADLAYHDITA